jgi:hypothetical protein
VLQSYSAPIVNGLLTADFPTTGALLVGPNAAAAELTCSGTLIGCETFLTAAHCVCDSIGVDCQGAGAPNPSEYFVYLQHGGVLAVSSIAIRPDFDFPDGDVAVLKLAQPLTGIAPSPINTTRRPNDGETAVIAGFGRTGGNAQDYGAKRAGIVTMGSCSAGVSSTASVCWKYQAPVGPAGSSSNTCNGDSGGPLFIDFGNAPVVAGITSGGTSETCLPIDKSYDANVYNYSSWIQAQGGADLDNVGCGSMPQVGTPGATVVSMSGSLSAGQSAVHSFTIPSGAAQLRVTLNGADDVDYYVKAGSPATTSIYDCKQDGSSGFGACSFAGPVSGTWYVLVRQFGGAGVYQLTATRFGVDCSDAANDGQPCDDSNSCTSGDSCGGGVCAGGAVTDGSACNDDNPCTNPDACQSGACVGGQTPATTCQGPFKPTSGSVRLRQPRMREERIGWRWLKGSATDKSAFGDPLNLTGYSLCVYDQAAGIDALVLEKQIPPGGMCGTRACWSKTSRGFRYANRSGAPSGISGLDLHSGVDGRAQITLRGHGENLLLPDLPLHQESAVTVQLTNGARCWEARYTRHVKNTETEFRAGPGQKK